MAPLDLGRIDRILRSLGATDDDAESDGLDVAGTQRPVPTFDDLRDEAHVLPGSAGADAVAGDLGLGPSSPGLVASASAVEDGQVQQGRSGRPGLTGGQGGASPAPSGSGVAAWLWGTHSQGPSADGGVPSTQAKVSLRPSARPGDLPPLHAPPGYRRDRRGTWRYIHDGSAVPGARDVTLDVLWPYGRHRPLLVPADEAAAFAELAWVPSVGVPAETTRRYRGTVVHLAAFEVDPLEWVERSRWPLGLSAPELAVDRLLSVTDVARLLGGVAKSTVTADLARGRFPAPQVRVAGRPAWSAPIVLAAVRCRPGNGR